MLVVALEIRHWIFPFYGNKVLMLLLRKAKFGNSSSKETKCPGSIYMVIVNRVVLRILQELSGDTRYKRPDL